MTASLVGVLSQGEGGSSARATVFGLGRNDQPTFRCMCPDDRSGVGPQLEIADTRQLKRSAHAFLRSGGHRLTTHMRTRGGGEEQPSGTKLPFAVAAWEHVATLAHRLEGRKAAVRCQATRPSAYASLHAKPGRRLLCSVEECAIMLMVHFWPLAKKVLSAG